MLLRPMARHHTADVWKVLEARQAGSSKIESIHGDLCRRVSGGNTRRKGSQEGGAPRTRGTDDRVVPTGGIKIDAPRALELRRRIVDEPNGNGQRVMVGVIQDLEKR